MLHGLGNSVDECGWTRKTWFLDAERMVSVFGYIIHQVSFEIRMLFQAVGLTNLNMEWSRLVCYSNVVRCYVAVPENRPKLKIRWN